MRVNLTSEDLAAGQLVEPGWFPVEIIKYEEKPSNGDRSTNCISHMKVIGGKGAGAKTRLLLNEKAFGFGKNFFKALGAKETTDPATGKPVMTGIILDTSLLGKKLDVYLVRGTSSRGNDFNDAKDFAPLGTNSGFKG